MDPCDRDWQEICFWVKPASESPARIDSLRCSGSHVPASMMRHDDEEKAMVVRSKGPAVHPEGEALAGTSTTDDSTDVGVEAIPQGFVLVQVAPHKPKRLILRDFLAGALTSAAVTSLVCYCL